MSDWVKEQERIFKDDSVIEEVPAPLKYPKCWQNHEWRKQYRRFWRLTHLHDITKWRRQYYDAHRDEILTKQRLRFKCDYKDPVKREKILASHRVKDRKYKMPQRDSLTDYERGFLEALIDGEGCISWTRQHAKSSIHKGWSFILLIANNNRAILEKAMRIMGRGTVKKAGLRRPNTWVYRTGANSLRWLLPQLKLIVKQKQQETLLRALKLVDYNGGQHDETYWRNLEEILDVRNRATGGGGIAE